MITTQDGCNEQGVIVDWAKFDAYMKTKSEARNKKYLEAIMEREPEGATCGWCGGTNTFCDDIGWIWITPRGDDTRVCCESCWWGPHGDAHRARYGVGDR